VQQSTFIPVTPSFGGLALLQEPRWGHCAMDRHCGYFPSKAVNSGYSISPKQNSDYPSLVEGDNKSGKHFLPELCHVFFYVYLGTYSISYCWLLWERLSKEFTGHSKGKRMLGGFILRASVRVGHVYCVLHASNGTKCLIFTRLRGLLIFSSINFPLSHRG
jgi:hypothetical protein